uniref:C2H2-type domain-containing protein n=1 Tax=Lutzomyia longipalpis TaxID=7200 RepID=A0A1B0CN25_LUTLO
HASSHSTTLSFTCSICRAHFRRKDNLRRHLKVIHPEENLLETLRESQQEVETEAAPPPPRTCSVIKFTGNAKPPSAVETQEEPQNVPEVQEMPPKVPQVVERPPKTKKPFDPLEIYRKILCPSHDDDDDEPPEPNPTPPVPPIVRKTSQEGNFVHWRKRTSLNFTQNARRKD